MSDNFFLNFQNYLLLRGASQYDVPQFLLGLSLIPLNYFYQGKNKSVEWKQFP